MLLTQISHAFTSPSGNFSGIRPFASLFTALNIIRFISGMAMFVLKCPTSPLNSPDIFLKYHTELGLSSSYNSISTKSSGGTPSVFIFLDLSISTVYNGSCATTTASSSVRPSRVCSIPLASRYSSASFCVNATVDILSGFVIIVILSFSLIVSSNCIPFVT